MTQRFKRLSHSIYECKYHLVFCPKYRSRIFKDEIGEYAKRKVYELCKQKEQIEALELNVRSDHVHLVASIPPKYAVSEFMGYLKGKIALRLFLQYENLGRRYWGRHLWTRGYCVSTAGLDEDKIRKYVQWQEKQEKQAEAVQVVRLKPCSMSAPSRRIISKLPPLAVVVYSKKNKPQRHEGRKEIYFAFVASWRFNSLFPRAPTFFLPRADNRQ